MRRRSVLRGGLGCLTAMLGGCLGRLPGATGPRNPPEAPADQPRRTPDRPDLVVGTFDFEATDDGSLRVFGTVENRSDVQRTATLRVTVGAGDEEFERETTVTVDSGATAEWSITFDVAYDDFASDGDISIDVA